MSEKIKAKKIIIFLGMDQNGQLVGNTHVITDNKKLYVIPGQLAIIEVETPQGKVVKEMPLGQFGWEYTMFELEDLFPSNPPPL